jgi:integrase
MARINVDLSVAIAATDDARPSLSFGEMVQMHEYARPDKALGPRLKKWVAAFGEINAWEVTAAQIARAGDTMIEAGYKPASVNRDVGSIGQIYNWAIRIRKIAPLGFHQPTRDVVKHPETMRKVVLTAEEVAKLRLLSAKAFPDRRFGLFIAMLLDSGARKTEIYERTWDELDIDGCTVLVPKTKNGDSRTLFFSKATMAMAAILRPTRANCLIFEGHADRFTPINYRKAWVSLAGMIQRPDLHLHDLRHAVAADLLENGVSIATASQIIGHRDQTMLLRRYAHLSVDHLRNAQKSRLEAYT